jgi:hypothetical protein
MDGYVCDPGTGRCIWPWELPDGGLDGADSGDGDQGPDGGDQQPFDCQEVIGGEFLITRMSLNDQGEHATVEPGGRVNVSFDYFATREAGCPECQNQLVTGLYAASYGHQEWHCHDLAKPPDCPLAAAGSVVFSESAPRTPGDYHLRVSMAEEVNCLHASEGYLTWAVEGRNEGTITVKEPDCQPWQVYLTNISLDGGGAEIEVEGGESIDFSAGYFASQMDGCPDCLDQIVVGIEGDAQLCEDMRIIPGCPQGKTGTISGTLTAPAQAGTYRILYDLIAHWDCDGAEGAYEANPPGLEWAAGIVRVLP